MTDSTNEKTNEGEYQYSSIFLIISSSYIIFKGEEYVKKDHQKSTIDTSQLSYDDKKMNDTENSSPSKGKVMIIKNLFLFLTINRFLIEN